MLRIRDYKKLSINEQQKILNDLKNLYLNTYLCRDEIIKQLNITVDLY